MNLQLREKYLQYYYTSSYIWIRFTGIYMLYAFMIL